MRDSGDGAGDWEIMYIHRCTHMHACISHWTHILYLQSFKDSKEERQREIYIYTHYTYSNYDQYAVVSYTCTSRTFYTWVMDSDDSAGGG